MQPKIVLGKDTVADKKYLEVSDERIAQMEYRDLPEKEKLMADKAKKLADAAELQAKIDAVTAREAAER